MLATATGAFTAWTLGMLPSTLMGAGSGAAGSTPAEPGGTVVYGLAFLMGLAAGTILGTPQWLVLRQFVPRASFLWVPANALAWAPGMVLAFYAADFLFAAGPGASTIVLAMTTLAAIGAIVGAIHGLALVWLVRLRQSASLWGWSFPIGSTRLIHRAVDQLGGPLRRRPEAALR